MKVDPVGAGFDEARLERLTEHFESRYIATGKIAGCQIAVTRGQTVAYWRSLGLMDRERGKPVEDDTIWRIYSMSKPIASVALMQLYERGLFQLSDPVHRYIPEWKDLKVGELQTDGSIRTSDPLRPPSIRDALTHMTGIAGGFAMGHPTDKAFADEVHDKRKGMTLEGVCSLLAQYPLKFQPGSAWNYGISTDVCARLVEILSGHSFDRYLMDNLFRPLGMVDTHFSVPDQSAERLAACYWYHAGGLPVLQEDPVKSSYRRKRSYLSGAGGLVSTSGDYVRFSQMLLNQGELDGNRIIGRKTLELMTRNHLPHDRDVVELAVGGFGLGFAVGKGPGRTATVGSAGEFYWGGAASTAFWIDPVEDLAVVFMTQLMPSSSYPFRSQLRALVYQALS